MIVCKTCGEQNENGTRFCSNCSSFLEWDGEAVPTGPVPVHLLDRTQSSGQPAPAPGTLGTPAPPPPGAPTNERPPTQPTTVINVPREMLNRPSRGMAGTAPGPTPPPPAPPAPPAGGYPPPPTAPSPMPPMGGPGYQPYPQQPPPAAATAAPTGQGPQARMPGAQQPSEPVRRRRRAAPAGTPQPGVAPGEIACRVCGTGNPPDRKFCRTCGTATMQDQAPPPERVGFWRRLFGGGNKNRVMQAGTRHDRIRQPAHLIRPIVIIVVIVGLLIVGFGPARPYIVEGYNLARDRFATQDPVTPSSWSSSSNLSKSQTPKLLGDGSGLTFWAPAKNPKTNGIGDSFTATFQPPVGRLLYVYIANGVSQLPQIFTTGGRVAQLHAVMTDDLGKTHEATIDLQDVSGIKPYPLPATDIVKIQFTISSIYSMSTGKALGLNDVRFTQDLARKYTQGSIK